MSLLQRLAEASVLTEGFSGYSVHESDSSSDLLHEVLKGVADTLRKGLADQGNSYNTPGFINVAMIVDQYLKQMHGFSDELDNLVHDCFTMYEDSLINEDGKVSSPPREVTRLFDRLKKTWV